MAQKKFTQLPVAGPITGSEVIAIVQDGSSKQIDLSNISLWKSDLITAIGPNTYVGALSPAITSYINGQAFKVKIQNTSTSVSTLDLGGGALKVFRIPSAQAGNRDLVNNVIYTLIYDTALDGGGGGFLMNIMDRYKGLWNWIDNSNVFPVCTLAGDYFITTDDYVDGDEFFASGTLLMATTNGASSFGDYLKK